MADRIQKSFVNPIIAPQEKTGARWDQPPFPTPDEPRFIIHAQPYWLEPPVNSQSFDFVKYVALPAVGANAVIIDFVVPLGMNGIIKRFGNAYVGSGFTEGSGGLLWQLLANTQPLKNYSAIPASLGATALPSEVSSIRIKEMQRIQLVIQNISLVVGGASSGGRLGGWFYPKTLEFNESFT